MDLAYLNELDQACLIELSLAHVSSWWRASSGWIWRASLGLVEPDLACLIGVASASWIWRTSSGWTWQASLNIIEPDHDHELGVCDNPVTTRLQ